MPSREEIIQEIAEFLAYHDNKEWDGLTDTDRFNYKSSARVLAVCLDNKGMVRIKNKKLPSIFNAREEVMSAMAYKKRLKNFVEVEGLIKEW